MSGNGTRTGGMGKGGTAAGGILWRWLAAKNRYIESWTILERTKNLEKKKKEKKKKKRMH